MILPLTNMSTFEALFGEAVLKLLLPIAALPSTYLLLVLDSQPSLSLSSHSMSNDVLFDPEPKLERADILG